MPSPLRIAIGRSLLLVAPLVSAPKACAQQPILELRVDGIGRTIVQGRLSSDGVLEIPTEPIQELTGEDLAGVPFISIDDLRGVFGPQVDVHYDPRRAMLTIRDPFGVLVASRELRESLRARAAVEPSAAWSQGPYAALTTDWNDQVYEAGWSFGRLSVGGAHSSFSGTQWGASLRAHRQLWLTYVRHRMGGSDVGVRWAGSGTFVRASYDTTRRDVAFQAAATLESFTAYVRDDGGTALSYRIPHSGMVTVARTTDGFTTRVSIGRPQSPFSIPMVR